MKKKKTLSRALALALTLSMLPTPTLAVSLGEKLGSEVDRSVYSTLKSQVEKIASGETASPVISVDDIRDQNVTIDAIKTDLILSALLADLPYHMYWSNKAMGTRYSYTTNEILTKLEFSFGIANDCTADAQVSADAVAIAKQAQDAADDIITKAKTLDSEYEQLKYCFEQIKSLVSYNHAAAGGGMAYGMPWQMTSVFDGDTSTNPVCEGYAKAFKYLCDGLEIDCYLVSGTMDGGNHMWNIVTIEGENYLADITNSDTGTVGAGGSLFLAGGSELQRLSADRAIGLAELLAELNTLELPASRVVLGDGAELCHRYLTENGFDCRLAPPMLIRQSAVGVALAAERKGEFIPAEALAPVYLRLSQAERERLEREKTQEKSS